MHAAMVLLLAVALQLVATPVANAQTACSELAEVGWQVNAESGRVDGAVVRVPGCEDGSAVGLQVVVGSEDLPATGPRVADVVDEEATFDLGDLQIAVGPVTGVKVFLALDEVEVDILSITVEQRFFSRSGHERDGMRIVNDGLRLAPAASYVVASAVSGYADVDCAEVNVSLGDGVVASGTGRFTATRSGTHLACYQQAPGTEPPEVLDAVLERGPDSGWGPLVDGDASTDDGVIEGLVDARERPGAATGRSRLSRTGIDAVTGGLAGLLLVLLGAAVIRQVRPRS